MGCSSSKPAAAKPEEKQKPVVGDGEKTLLPAAAPEEKKPEVEEPVPTEKSPATEVVAEPEAAAKEQPAAAEEAKDEEKKETETAVQEVSSMKVEASEVPTDVKDEAAPTEAATLEEVKESDEPKEAANEPQLASGLEVPVEVSPEEVEVPPEEEVEVVVTGDIKSPSPKPWGCLAFCKATEADTEVILPKAADLMDEP